MKLYTVRDVLAGYGVSPGVPAILNMINDDVAIRVVDGCLVEGAQPNVFNTNTTDKELWCVGEFDDKTGKITPCDPYLVCRAVDRARRSVKDDKID